MVRSCKTTVIWKPHFPLSSFICNYLGNPGNLDWDNIWPFLASIELIFAKQVWTDFD